MRKNIFTERRLYMFECIECGSDSESHHINLARLGLCRKCQKVKTLENQASFFKQFFNTR